MPQKPKIDAPLSESSVSHKLTEIQKRCSELMEEPEGLTELSLVDSEPKSDGTDPYNYDRQP